jgi:predicted RNase H-like nuclease (RuvC/YqgF family)
MPKTFTIIVDEDGARLGELLHAIHRLERHMIELTKIHDEVARSTGAMAQAITLITQLRDQNVAQSTALQQQTEAIADLNRRLSEADKSGSDGQAAVDEEASGLARPTDALLAAINATSHLQP